MTAPIDAAALGALVERLRRQTHKEASFCVVSGTKFHMPKSFDEIGAERHNAAAAIEALLATLSETTRERDEARAALNRGRHADEDCPIAAYLDDIYERSDDDQDKMHLAMAAYELRRGPFDHPDHFGCEIQADEQKARIAELEKANREAITLIDELNERAPSRVLWGISQTLHAKLCTVRATLARSALRTAARSGGGE